MSRRPKLHVLVTSDGVKHLVMDDMVLCGMTSGCLIKTEEATTVCEECAIEYQKELGNNE